MRAGQPTSTMQTHEPKVSLLTPIGYHNSSCGYCKNKSSSSSYYASSTSLTPKLYQSLLDRGWRRSGRQLYKPDLRVSCCPQYTLRLDSHLFHASKDQRQALNRFNKHVLGDSYIKDAARLYPRSREQAKKRNTDFDLVERVHESENGRLQTPPEPAHNLVVTLEPDSFSEEKYCLFENYQRLVHHEPPHRIRRNGFKSFLCSSPLIRGKENVDGDERELGSFHQCYRLDGKLIALGVLDLLPQCVSAVYFMYHESVHQNSFGKIGALREIALAREEGYRWWYAGFYIHNCVKMKYKGEYTPQYLLDPSSYDWHLLDDEMKKRLDKSNLISFSGEQGATPTNAPQLPEEVRGVLMETDDILEDDDSGSNAASRDIPLFKLSMPGILTKDQLSTEIDLDHIQLRIGSTDTETSDLVSWDTSDMDDVHSLKCIIAELVSAVGPEVAREMVVHFVYEGS